MQLYFKNSTASLSSHGSLQRGGTAPSSATTGTGFKVAKNGAGRYCLQAFNTANNTAFGTTALPAAAPGSSDCWRSEGKLSGTIQSGTWDLFLSCIAVGTAATGSGRFRLRVWKDSADNGSTATELTSSSILTGSYSNLTTGTAQHLSASWAHSSPVTLSDEYLFFQVALETLTASGSNNANVTLRVDATNARIVIPGFAYELTEEFDVSDQALVDPIRGVSLLDTVATSDSATRLATLGRAGNDGLSVLDIITTLVGLGGRGGNDGVSMLDTLIVDASLAPRLKTVMSNDVMVLGDIATHIVNNMNTLDLVDVASTSDAIAKDLMWTPADVISTEDLVSSELL